MKVNSKIQKWGNGLAIRISGLLRDIPRFTEGMPVEIQISEDGLKISKLPSKPSILPFSEDFLLAGITPQTAHADIISNPLEGEY
jgi:antitoxin MazE